MYSSQYLIIVTASVALSFFLYIVLTGQGVMNSHPFESPFYEKIESLNQRGEQRAIISTLKEAMPLLAEKTIHDPGLSESQIKALKLLYIPIVEDFVASGNPKLIREARLVKNAILNGK